MTRDDDEKQNTVIIDEVLMLLQVKRTALEAIRIGIRIVIVQTIILSVLIATSRYYDLLEVTHLIIPFVLLNALLLCLSGYLIIGSLMRIHRLDHRIHRIQHEHSKIARFME
jgi:hypothetical protein